MSQSDELVNQINGLEDLGDQVSFLQLGRMRYMVTPVGQDISIIEELKAYVQSQVSNVKEQLSDVFEKDVDAELNKQIQHIERLKRRGQVAIPSNMQDQVVKLVEGRVCPVKSFVFKPWCVKTSYGDLVDIVAPIEADKFRVADTKDKFNRRRSSDGAFSLTFDSPYALPGAVALTPTNLVIVNELSTNHTYTGNKRLCVGDADPKQVFALSSEALGTQLSIYNRFSPLSQTFAFGPKRWAWPDWLHACTNFDISIDTPHGQRASTTAASAVPAAEWRA